MQRVSERASKPICETSGGERGNLNGCQPPSAPQSPNAPSQFNLQCSKGNVADCVHSAGLLRLFIFFLHRHHLHLHLGNFILPSARWAPHQTADGLTDRALARPSLQDVVSLAAVAAAAQERSREERQRLCRSSCQLISERSRLH